MPCYHPLRAFRLEDGSITFVERGRLDGSLELPCGQCIGCRLERSRQWAIRCVHEASLHKQNIFLTLTYRDDALPAYGSLSYRHVQLFLKRLRRHIAPMKVRFFCAGEYGEELRRPHYHMCLFGWSPSDPYPVAKDLYSSKLLEQLWPHGHASFGEVTFASAGYVARYCLKKINGKDARHHYEAGIDPTTGEVITLEKEFAHMSLKPGIGAGWFKKYSTEVYPFDEIIINGKPVKPPKYYDKLFDKIPFNDLDQVRAQRELDAYNLRSDNTSERLAVKEQVTTARSNLSKRKLP
ncbi:MAG: replication initiator protein [Microvirus sp.]|nr:MAG: replication initiator protein [Microvirus sp.]